MIRELELPSQPHVARLKDALATELYRRAGFPQLIFFPVIYILYVMLADAIVQQPAIRWVFAATVAIQSLRMVSVTAGRWMRRRYRDPGVRTSVFAIGALASGVGMGIINLMAGPFLTPEQVGVMVCATAGFNSVTIISMNTSLRSYFMSMLPHMGSVPFMVAMCADMQHRDVLLILVGANLIALVVMAVQSHLHVRRSMLLRFRINDANEYMKNVNISLQSEISERHLAESSLAERNAELQLLNEQLAGAQGQLLQSEKMASIGQLAAGVAHEINNPIAFVGANLQSLKGYLGEMVVALDSIERADDPRSDQVASNNKAEVTGKVDVALLREDLPALLNESIDGILRVAKIVKDLKDFSHVDDSGWQFVDVHKGLETTLSMAGHELRYKIDVRRQYGQLPLVECLPFQINQVFLNLIVNAAQSIEGGGVLTIATGAGDGQVWIRVADTGRGIEPDDMPRIFDPFFTTKPVGSGTGLGLSLSYSIVRKHFGSIEVASEVGKGTVFTIRLPVLHRAEPA